MGSSMDYAVNKLSHEELITAHVELLDEYMRIALSADRDTSYELQAKLDKMARVLREIALNQEGSQILAAKTLKECGYKL